MTTTRTPTSGAADLRTAAQAVVDRWDTPLWKDVPATAEYIGRLRAALAAGQATAAQAVVPSGWNLVPTEPTQAMLDAVVTSMDDFLLGKEAEKQYREDWAAMLAAAPAQPAAQQGVAYAATPTSNYAGRVYEEGFLIGTCPLYTADQLRAFADRTHALRASRGQAPADAAPSAGAVAGPDDIDAIALTRYKVVHSHDSMFHRFAVVAGDGKQQLYLGRETECQNMTRKFAGAFLDGAFYQSQIAAAPTPAAQAADSVQEDAARVFTYKNQPCNNVTAWRFGEACRAAQPGGDPIDHGLSLLQKLQERGYGIVAIDAAMNKGGAA